MSKMLPNGRSKMEPHHVRLYEREMKTPAWRTLSSNAKVLLIAMRLSFTGINNGAIKFGVREAGEAIGASHVTAARALDELVHRGWIRCTRGSAFGQTRLVREWALTNVGMKVGTIDVPATRDYMRWQPSAIGDGTPKAKPRFTHETIQFHPRNYDRPVASGSHGLGSPVKLKRPKTPPAQFHQVNTTTMPSGGADPAPAPSPPNPSESTAERGGAIANGSQHAIGGKVQDAAAEGWGKPPRIPIPLPPFDRTRH